MVLGAWSCGQDQTPGSLASGCAQQKLVEPCLRQVAFQSTDTGRRFLACAKEKVEEKCCYLEWIDPECARLAISYLKEEIEKKKLADHSSTNLHQVLRAKAQKESDQLVLERDQMKEEKKKLECIIADMMKQNNGYKDKVKKLKEICDEF
ncbi:hypothetical protein D1007_25834 [Hordeum vulgare]|nr:hypothetical protein D1007_25834 [Hordeum vulgare]